jgi:hypothetical protein
MTVKNNKNMIDSLNNILLMKAKEHLLDKAGIINLYNILKSQLLITLKKHSASYMIILVKSHSLIMNNNIMIKLLKKEREDNKKD